MLLLGLHNRAGLGRSHIHRLCHRPTYLPTLIADVFPMAGKNICVLDIGLSLFIYLPITCPPCYKCSLLNTFYSQPLPLHFLLKNTF